MSSNTFFVFLPSNVPDYPQNQPNRYRVRLPKPLHFSGSWQAGLYSISYPYSWPSTIGTLDQQYIGIHIADQKKIHHREIRIPVPPRSHTDVESLKKLIEETLKNQIGEIDLLLSVVKSPPLSPLKRTKRALEKDSFEESPPYAESPPQPGSEHPSPDQTPPKSTKVDGGDKAKSQQKQQVVDTQKQAKPPQPTPSKPVEKPQPPIQSMAVTTPQPPKVSPSQPSGQPTAEPGTRAPLQVSKSQPTLQPQKPIVRDQRVQTQSTPQPAPSPSPISQTTQSPKPKPASLPKSQPAPLTPQPTPLKTSKPQSVLPARPQPQAEQLKVQTNPPPPSSAPQTTTNHKSPSPPPPPSPPPLIEKEKEQPIALPPKAAALTQTPSEDEEREKGNKQRSIISTLFGAKQEKKKLDIIGILVGEKDEKNGDNKPSFAGTPLIWQLEKIEEFKKNVDLELLKNLIGSLEIEYLYTHERFKLRYSHPQIEYISFSAQLGYVLGFEDPQSVLNNTISKFGCDLRGGFTSFAVYVNGLTENVIFGNSLSSLLRVVSVSGKPGDYIEKNFDSQIFARVIVKEVSEIEIELRTMDNGRLVPFSYGTVMIVLIFKKVIEF